MNTKQREFYEANVKRVVNLRREREDGLAIKLETINQLLKHGKISQALQWACAYKLPLDFILEIKDLFSGFSD